MAELLSRRTMAVALIGFVLGVVYRYAADDPSEGTLLNYLRSGLHGLGIAVVAWLVNAYFRSRSSAWLHRWPVLAEIALRALVMTLAISLATLVLQALLFAEPLQWQWLAYGLPRIAAFALVASFVFDAIFELVRLIGGRVLLNVILGRYRHPVREERVLMFLDLADSTRLAETLGEVRTQELLTRFFFDIDGPIVGNGGEVHAYVGDEVIVTWPIAPEVADGRCVECFFAIEVRMAHLAESYRRQFGIVPQFRAALHAGPVVISECGNSRRQIAYFGDTMNVAKRLEEHGQAIGRTLVASAALLERVRPGSNRNVKPLGRVELRGRSAQVDVFAIEGARG